MWDILNDIPKSKPMKAADSEWHPFHFVSEKFTGRIASREDWEQVLSLYGDNASYLRTARFVAQVGTEGAYVLPQTDLSDIKELRIRGDWTILGEAADRFHMSLYR